MRDLLYMAVMVGVAFVAVAGALRLLQRSGLELPGPLAAIADMWAWAAGAVAALLGALVVWRGSNGTDGSSGPSEVPDRPPSEDIEADTPASDQADEDADAVEGDELEDDIGSEFGDLADDLRGDR